MQRIVSAIIIIAVGLGLLLGSFSIYIPSQYNTFLGIPYSVNPNFVFAFYAKLLLLIMGLFVMIVGLLVLAFASLFHKPEKKTDSSQIPPPPPPP